MAAGHRGALPGASRGRGSPSGGIFLLAVVVARSSAKGYIGAGAEPHHGRRPRRSSTRGISPQRRVQAMKSMLEVSVKQSSAEGAAGEAE
jgi:hypothetical protein